MVAQKGEGAEARHPRDFWHNTFHDEKTNESRKERDKDKAGKEKSAPPERIRGIGDEAFWIGNKIAGALYVLKGDAYIPSVSVAQRTHRAHEEQKPWPRKPSRL